MPKRITSKMCEMKFETVVDSLLLSLSLAVHFIAIAFELFLSLPWKTIHCHICVCVCLFSKLTHTHSLTLNWLLSCGFRCVRIIFNIFVCICYVLCLLLNIFRGHWRLFTCLSALFERFVGYWDYSLAYFAYLFGIFKKNSLNLQAITYWQYR